MVVNFTQSISDGLKFLNKLLLRNKTMVAKNYVDSNRKLSAKLLTLLFFS